MLDKRIICTKCMYVLYTQNVCTTVCIMSRQLEKPHHYETLASRLVVIQLFQLTRHDTNSCTYTMCI